MESPDLKSPSPEDPALEAWLRAHSALPPLPGDDFSRRVLVALPRPSRRHSRRSWLCLAALVLGGALALAGVVTAGSSVADDLFVSLDNPLAAPPALIAIAVALGSLWFAFRDRLRLLPR